MATLFDIIKQNKEGNLSSIPVYKDGGSLNWDKMNINQRRSYIFNFLKGKGLNEIQSASIVGNLEQENGKFDTKMTNSIGATGIAQWYKTRADALRSKGNHTHINTQLNYLLEELNGNKHWSTKAGGRDAFFKAKDLKTATQIFRKDFERPGEAEAHDNKRYKYALNVIGKNNEYTPYDNSPSSSEYIAEDSPYSKYDFSNQKLDYSQMNAQMESNQAFQKAMIEAMQSETNSKIALNQAQVYAIEQEQAEKISSQEAEKRKVEQDKIQSVLEEKNKQRDILMEIGLQTIPKYIERDETALRQLASSPMNFQFQGGFQQLVQGQEGGEFETINLDEVVVRAETPLTKLGKEYEKVNNFSNFVYGKPQTIFDSYQTRKEKYDKLRNEYIANEISKQYTGKRGRILNEIRNEYGDEMHDFVITNSTNRDVRENVYDNFKSGVLNINGSFNPYRSNREQSKRGNVLLDRLGDIGDISSPLSVPYNVALGKKVANSKGETDYTYSDAFSGVVPKEREMTAEIAGDPLNLLGIGIADEALKGFKSIKNILPITAKEQKIFSIDDLVNSNNYYRVIRGEESFNDIANKGIVRSVPPVNTNSIGKINLGGRPTAFPSFSKGKVSKEYAEGDPLNYIIESNSDKIKVSTLGRHGKGTTYFPTDIEGNYINSLDAGEINLYKHLGEGKYEKVINNIKNKQLFEKGGMFHKMYDERNKVNINSFKTRFIK